MHERERRLDIAQRRQGRLVQDPDGNLLSLHRAAQLLRQRFALRFRQREAQQEADQVHHKATAEAA